MLEHKEHTPGPGQSRGPGTWKQAVYTCKSLHGERDIPMCARAAWPCKAVEGQYSCLCECARMYTALQGGQVGRDSNQHQIKHEPTPKSMLRGGKGHAFLWSRGRSCAAHPQAAPGARMLPMCFEVCLGQVGTHRPCGMGLLCFPGQKLLHRSSSSIFPKFKRKA